MKRLCLLVLVLTVVAVAQEQAPPPAQQPMQRSSNRVERAFAPTYSDLNCAGFISKENYNHGNYLIAGGESPSATQFSDRETVFLEGGGYAEGQQYSIIRELRDPNRYPAFYGQGAAIAAVGQPYQELGRVRVTGLRGKTAIAVVEFSCTAMVAGDLAVPYVEKQAVQYRTTDFSRFPTSAGSVSGRIVMAKEFDVVLAEGHKVYLNVGSSQGVKVGDYFRAVRSYDPAKQDPVEALSYKAQQTEDTMKRQPKITGAKYAELPHRALGEMIVLGVTPTSATAMVTMSLEHINVGDMVEMENIVAEPPPAAAATPPQPPTISCTASPVRVQAGQPSTISCVGQSPDNRPLTYQFTSTGGRLTPGGAQATLDTAGALPGSITVNSTVSDDRGLTASAGTTVGITAAQAAAPQASKCGSFDFSRDKRRPARVDNVGKAVLDDCSLRLQQDPSAHAVIVGNADPNEANAARMAQQRANNTKDYLVNAKGIDAARLEVRTGTAGTQTADVWIVPMGASLPQ